MKRGDLVLVEVPYLSGTASKLRPVLIVQGDDYNRRLSHTIVAAISTKMRPVLDPAHLLLDPATPEGQQAGVHHRSIVRCDRIFTIEQHDIRRTIGTLSASGMSAVEACLKAALELT